MNFADTGDCLRAGKSSPDVILDWSIFGGSGNFMMRRGTIGDFYSYSNIFGPSSLKTCDDAVLEDTNSYWYDARNRSLTDTLYFYHADHLGTPIAMTDTSGTLVWRAEHSPFGGIYALTVGTIPNNLRFSGQYYDSETGLAQNWFRDYEAKIGRYSEPDPVEELSSSDCLLKQSTGLIYSYSSDNPIKITDPLGLWIVDESCKCNKDKVEKATKKACSNQTISKLPIPWKWCASNKCKFLTVKCGGWLCGKIGGAGASIPVFGSSIYVCNPTGENQCGLANTVLHETLHKCGATDSPLSSLAIKLHVNIDAQNLANAAVNPSSPCQ